MSAGHLASFLDGERRQVWALHRETGEPFFLPEGQAEALRGFTKSSLRCTHPDCTVQISTRGGTKRDHLFHVSSPGHETGRESEFHLAGKAMLTQWASPRIPEGATVREEHTVKDPETRMLRRADVMVTGRAGRQVAFEVEYKSYAVDAWRAKQNDYDTHGIACAWLIGHTKVRMATGPSYLVGLGETAVRVPELAAQIARAGYPLVVINPATRQVGTLAGDATFTSRFWGIDTIAWIAVNDLDDCDFSPRGGIITPALRRIAAAEAEAARQEELEQVRNKRPTSIGMWRGPWEGSALRATFLARWGELPALLARDAGMGGGILAELPLWHGAIYEELLHESTEDFKWRDVFAALDRHAIKRHQNEKMVYRTIMAWLEAMEKLGLLRIHRDSQRRVLLFSPAGLTLNDVEDSNAPGEHRSRVSVAFARQVASTQRHRAEADRIRAERQAMLDDRRRTDIEVQADADKLDAQRTSLGD